MQLFIIHVPLNKNTKESRHCHPPTCFPKTQLPLHSSCPELAENPPHDWVFITSLRGKQVPLWFLSWCSSLVQKELVGNTPQTDLFSLKPSSSVVSPRGRQQLSSGILRLLVSFCCTALTDCLYPLLTSFLGCKLRGCFSHCSGKEHLLAHGCLLPCLACLLAAQAHRAGSILGMHQLHIWLCHLLSESQIQCGQSAARVSWGFNRVEVTRGNENCKVFSATRGSSLRKLSSTKTSVYRTIIILNVFKNRNRKYKSPI